MTAIVGCFAGTIFSICLITLTFFFFYDASKRFAFANRLYYTAVFKFCKLLFFFTLRLPTEKKKIKAGLKQRIISEYYLAILVKADSDTQTENHLQ